MEEFRSYLPDAVIHANLSETAQRMMKLSEQEHAHIAELAAEMLAEGRQPSDLLASLPDRRLPEPEPSAGILGENLATVLQMQKLHALWQRLLLASELRSGLEFGKHDIPEFFFSETETPDDSAKGRVIYQRSNYADLAFRHFFGGQDSVHALYTHSFSVVCEEVMRGNCEYCILPLETSSDRMIDRYSLKIVASCDIPIEDGKKMIRFALLRRSLVPLFQPIDGNTLFECVIPLTDSLSVADLLLAAECCGLKLCRIDSGFYLIDESSVHAIHTVFSIGQGDLCSYLVYLAMQTPDFEMIGLYSQHPL
ncbi:MAG: hypothetical protein IJW49_10100 [Clostridia bacterium]|nr:hypothetical protein [Clostridia bacterium]